MLRSVKMLLWMTLPLTSREVAAVGEKLRPMLQIGNPANSVLVMHYVPANVDCFSLV